MSELVSILGVSVNLVPSPFSNLVFNEGLVYFHCGIANISQVAIHAVDLHHTFQIAI